MNYFKKFKQKFLLNKSVNVDLNTPDFANKKIFTEADYGYLLSLIFEGREVMCLRDAKAEINSCNVLRHDVDHDINTALKMAVWERERGITSTYCLLHTAWYYGCMIDGCYKHSSLLKDSVARLDELGHEINFHNNIITVAFLNKINPYDLLMRELEFFSVNGIDIVGTSTHGDALCRKYGYRNFHLFSEIAAAFPPDLSDDCPKEIRDAIGSVKMSEAGLSYEAYGIVGKKYVSDSGGKLISHLKMPGWGGATDSSLLTNNVGVYALTHPVWWSFK